MSCVRRFSRLQLLKRNASKRRKFPKTILKKHVSPFFSWVDEMILTSTWPQRTRWQHLMLSYYNTFNAGEEFFSRLHHLPPQANDVREIYYLCLSLGFLGQYAFGDGPSEVKKLKESTLRTTTSGSKGDIRRNYSLLFPEAYQKAGDFSTNAGTRQVFLVCLSPQCAGSLVHRVFYPAPAPD